MRTVIAKFLVFIACAILQYITFPISAKYIIIMLLAIILCCAGLIFQKDIKNIFIKILMEAVVFIFFGATFLEPMTACFLPLFFFELCYYKSLPGIFLYVLCVIHIILRFPPEFCVFNVLTGCVAAFLQYQIKYSEQLEQKLKILRDNSKEQELIIKEKNKTLRDNQDTQIYMATLKERNRIAREIHDNVGHLLTRSILQVGAIKTINQAQELKQPLTVLHETLNTAMSSIRNSVHDLHDESIDLYCAITEIIRSVDQLEIRLEYDMDKIIPRDIKYCFISVTKEAVSNTLKHSNATCMDILMREHPGFYQLMICDNGTLTKAADTGGIGIANIADRVKSLNGNLKISTEHGFKIIISIIKKTS